MPKEHLLSKLLCDWPTRKRCWQHFSLGHERKTQNCNVSGKPELCFPRRRGESGVLATHSNGLLVYLLYVSTGKQTEKRFTRQTPCRTTAFPNLKLDLLQTDKTRRSNGNTPPPPREIPMLCKNITCGSTMLECTPNHREAIFSQLASV